MTDHEKRLSLLELAVKSGVPYWDIIKQAREMEDYVSGQKPTTESKDSSPDQLLTE